MTDVLIINQTEVQHLLSMETCIELMTQALEALARGDAVQPLRTATWLPDHSGLIGMMPGFLGTPQVLGVKAVSVFPGNHGTPFDSHQGVILLFDVQHGQLLAVLDATEITAIRTAAVSAVATKLLARKDACELAILGSGVQAHHHLQAMCLVRDIKSVCVWSRNPDHARCFAKRETKHHNLSITPIQSGEDAVRNADIICTVTASREPVLNGQWIAPGTHINAVGACIAAARELDTQAIVQSSLFVDSRVSVLNEAGDYLIPKSQGALEDSHIQGEIGELLLGRVGGRTGDDEITLFKSLGLAIEDLAAAHYVYHSVKDQKIGTSMMIGGRRDATT